VADNVIDALADVIEDDGVVNERTWADDAPKSPTYPYVTLHDAITMSPDLKGDTRTLAFVRQVQASLWERLDRENPDVAARLIRAIDGAKVTLDSGHRIRFAVEGAPRLPEVDANIAHRALTISVRHDPAVG
jgi:hypothetical protein